MKILSIFQSATEFGTFGSRKNFFSFTLKCIFYIIPAVILGNYTDIAIQQIKDDKRLGDDDLYYILLQTFISISTLYLTILFFADYTSEFQVTVAGGFFSVLYFGMQPNYIRMIRGYINNY